MIEKAVQQLNQGGLVIFPTETVYGLGADATNQDAIAKIYRIKNRPTINPLIIHFHHLAQIGDYAIIDKRARELMAKFMPGPISFILPQQPQNNIAKNALANLNTIAVRVPNHPIALDLLAKFAKPIAAPSANYSGQLSPTRHEHIRIIAKNPEILILDPQLNQPCAIGLESTILDLTGEEIMIYRPGFITARDIFAQTGYQCQIAPPNKAIKAPGALLHHYAPLKSLRINAIHRQDNEFFIGFADIQGDFNLSHQGNLGEAAQNLFHALWLGDQSHYAKIAICPIAHHDIGMAINEKLSRASISDYTMIAQ